MTRAEALADAYLSLTAAAVPAAEARVEALLLLRHATNLSREELFLRPGVSLTRSEQERFGVAIVRRARREPLAYITGTRDFYGLTFAVTPDVLIPRPETEGIVEAVLGAFDDGNAESPPAPNSGGAGGERAGASRSTGERTSPASPSGSPRIGGGGAPGETVNLLDLCTGSGCVAVAVAVHLPDARIIATDISAGALAVARSNAERNGVADRVAFFEGDLLAAVPPGMRFAVIASNPPYIAPDEIERLEPEVRDFEPRVALGLDPDALYFYRRIASESPAFLAEGGSVVVEVGQGQADAVIALFRTAGFRDVSVRPDLAGIPRVVVACRSADSEASSGSPGQIAG